MLKSANLCGDADSVTSVTGQIAGAIYGATSIPKDWIKIQQQWDNNGEIALRAYKLFYKFRSKIEIHE
jgi:ADP-ribosyl-[dinitrogen reductase] hydrolase